MEDWKTGRLEDWQNYLEDNEIKASYESEEDDEFVLPQQFTARSYPNNTEETTQNAMLFAKAITNLNRVFKSSAKIEIGQTKTEFISVHKEENETEAVIEITDSEGAGNARIKIWGTKSDSKKPYFFTFN